MKPFVYAIRDVTDGTPHFDELCVATDPQDLEDHIEGDASLEVVPLYLAPNIVSLEWETEEDNWWVSQPVAMIGGYGYGVRLTDRGAVRCRRGHEDWWEFDGTVDQAKAHWQSDFESRIRSALA